ncbi:MAG: serine hydrolase domain-containing protein [Desulfobulbaceae bacterium]|nr:serine hydrolase domain-containing protein [Desulfobulbaceae bacterium]
MKNSAFFQLEKHLDSLFANALENGIFSGAAAAIFCREKGVEKRVIKTYGRTRKDASGEKITSRTFFDLASLTKPLCTALSVLNLIENKKLTWSSDLQSPLLYKNGLNLLPITIEQLLSHRSGLIDYKPFFRDFEAHYSAKNKKRLIEKILREPLAGKPGIKCVYSDLGFIILGEIIEQLSEKKLDIYFKENISGLLQLETKLFFRPLPAKQENNGVDFAATELCPWRKRLLQGEVHDEHCWLMGGVAGHAGLFGTIEGVLQLTEHILKQWLDRSKQPVFSNTLLQHALNKKFPGETWCLGFDRPSPGGSSSGKYLSSRSVGHLGYTGTSFWIDPEKEIIMVLLSNRIHPTRKNEKIKQFRPLFHDTVIESLQKQ